MRFLDKDGLQHFYDKLKVKLSSLDTEITNIQNGNISIDWSKITNAPTKLSQFTNDAGYVTNKTVDLSSKQDKLVSGTNIKTINNQSLLGSGNITISSGLSNSEINSLITKALESYTPTSNFATINGSKITDGGNITISGGGGTADSVAWGNITGKPSFATVATSGDYSDLSGTPDLSSYATKEYVTNAINNASISGGDVDLSNYVTFDDYANSTYAGVIKTNYSQNGKNYPVKVDSSGNAYVYVPWVAAESSGGGDGDTTYTLSKSGSTITLTASDGTTSSVTDSNTTYSNATTSAAGLMSASDKSNLDTVVSKVNNISSGANKVAWKQNVTSGTQIATITIDGTSTAVYAPAATAGTTYSGSSAGSNATPDTTSNGAITVSGTTISTTATADCAIPTATITSLCSSILS